MTDQADDPNVAEPGARSRRWRDDPLSVFLAIAAVLLGGMYLLEQRDVSVLEEAATHAQALATSSLNMDGCTLGSAGARGATLVVSCTTTANEAASVAATRSPDLTGFEAVVFEGSDAQLHCTTEPSMWPIGCIPKALPTMVAP